jgi:NADH-quinone oxidoreductase subunit M
LIFLAFVLIYYSVDPHTFLLKDLMGGKLAEKSFGIMGVELPVSGVAFGLISLGLALRVPVWPLHGWFTRGAKESPASVFLVSSAVCIPVATYVFIRLCYSLFPETLVGYARVVVVVGAINLIIGGLCAVAQKEIRLLLAYLSMTALGFIMVGIGSLNAAGLVGAVYQQLSVGLALACFGLFSGLVVERAGHCQFSEVEGAPRFGGLALQAPVLSFFAGIMIAALLGFPGTGGFVGQSLLIIGSYAGHPWIVILGGLALLLSAYYLFNLYRQFFLGEQGSSSKGFGDLSLREQLYLLPLLAGIVFCGLYPKPLLELVRPTVLTLLSTIK